MQWFAPYPDPAPDWARGALTRNLLPTSDDVLRRGIAHSEVGLWRLPGAADISSGWPLANTMKLLRELDALGILDDLALRIQARVRSRYIGPGRPRYSGRPIVLYLAYVDSRWTSVEYFHTQMSRKLLQLASYGDRRPAVSEVEDRFAELEKDADVLREVRMVLVRGAAAAEPRLVQTGWVDGTAALATVRLRHACEGPCASSASTIGSSAVAAIDHARWSEVGRGDYGTDGFVPASGRTRLPHAMFVSRSTREPAMFAMFRSQSGCLYVSRDPWVGFRSYETGTRWVGFNEVVLGLNFVDEEVDAEYVPADVQEYDALPGLFSSVGPAVFPQVVSLDRAYFTRAVFEYLTRRRCAPVIPERRFPGRKEHIRWRTDTVDEDGVLRCEGCGGPVNQAVSGGGLHIVHGEPVVRGRCALPVSERCDGWMQRRCSTEWFKITALNAAHPLYHAVSARHMHPEATHGRNVQRHQTAAKEGPLRLARGGLRAQQLRKQASLLLTWSRICFRNGWLMPVLSEFALNDAKPVLLSGKHTRAGRVIEPGIGADPYEEMLAERAATGADRPYGRAHDQNMKRLRAWSENL